MKKEVEDNEASEDFISSKYDDLKKEYDCLLNTNQKQKEVLKCAKEKLAKLEKNSTDEIANLENLKLYGRRQNLEFSKIPECENEDVVKIVVDVSELLGVEIYQSDIRIAHRLPAKP